MSIIAHLAARRLHKVGLVNFSEGFRMLRDPNVPVSFKLRALGVGLGITTLLALLEVPLEGVLAFLLPIAGELMDLAVDGIEFLVLPLLFATLVIQRFPREPFLSQGR